MVTILSSCPRDRQQPTGKSGEQERGESPFFQLNLRHMH